MYMGHVLFPKKRYKKQKMAHIQDKKRIKIGNKTWPMYMINKEQR
jgi:hypothetical protein